MKRCAFCAYWCGNADIDYDYGNSTYSYNQLATDGCDKKKMKRRANDSCLYFTR